MMASKDEYVSLERYQLRISLDFGKERLEFGFMGFEGALKGGV
jgi:hypothetical protein